MEINSTKNIIKVAIGVCVVCAVLVSTASVVLKPVQKKNKKLEKLKNILYVADLLDKDKNIEKIFKEKIQPAIIELKTGKELSKKNYTKILNPDCFDIKKLPYNPKLSVKIARKKDIAGIKRKSKYMIVYFVKQEGKIKKIILPVYGLGLWSTMYGLLALDDDLKTVSAFTFYEHGETPGLGGEVDNPRWRKLWKGKIVFDKNWELKIEIIKGKVDVTKNDAKYKIDGLSGATITTRGINDLVRFWLGESGYGTFLKKLREGGVAG